MSHHIYPTRLYWVGLRGIAKLEGHEVKLVAPPHLPNLQVEALDYAPNVVAMVMPRFGGWRDMFADEIEAAERLLRELTTKGT